MAQNNLKKQVLGEIVNRISYLGCLANYNFILVVDYTFFQLLQMMYYKKIADLSHCFKCQEKYEFKVIFSKHLLKGSN